MEKLEKQSIGSTRTSILIIVNGRPHEWEDEREIITFEQLIVLAFGSISNDPNIVYTVIYKNGPQGNPEGSMVRGDLVKIQTNMIFNATQTDKS